MMILGPVEGAADMDNGPPLADHCIWKCQRGKAYATMLDITVNWWIKLAKPSVGKLICLTLLRKT